MHATPRATRTVVALFCAVFVLTTVGAQSPGEKHDPARTRKLLELSGAGEMGKMVSDQLIGQLSQTMPDVPQEFWDEFRKEVKPETLTELIIPVYERHFTPPDIDQLIAFYESPIGRKLVEKQPALVQDAMQVGQRWGQDLGMQVARRLQERGIQPK